MKQMKIKSYIKIVETTDQKDQVYNPYLLLPPSLLCDDLCLCDFRCLSIPTIEKYSFNTVFTIGSHLFEIDFYPHI